MSSDPTKIMAALLLFASVCLFVFVAYDRYIAMPRLRRRIERYLREGETDER